MIKKLLRRIRGFLIQPVLDILNAPHHKVNVDVGNQILLSMKYREMVYRGIPLPSFDEVGFKEYSGSNEDGILLYIFSLIGTTNKKVVDIGAAGIEGSNVANLIINHGWTGLLVDADENVLMKSRMFYGGSPEVWRFPPTIVNDFVTAENINKIIRDNDYGGEVELLSIDLDGVDYWIWDAIDIIYPRVVIVEVQDIIGPEKSLTIPYNPDFKNEDWNYVGASLPAYAKLAREKGYRLVGCSRYGINAFFVRSSIGEEWLPEVPVKSCFVHPRHKIESPKRWDKVKNMPWVEV